MPSTESSLLLFVVWACYLVIGAISDHHSSSRAISSHHKTGVISDRHHPTGTISDQSSRDRRSPSICARVAVKPETRFSQERPEAAGRGRSERLNCSLKYSLVRIETDRQHGRLRVTIYACPSVSQLVVHVTGPAHFNRDDVSNRLRVVSCHQKQDTAVVNNVTRHQTLWLNPSSASNTEEGIRLSLSYQYTSQKGGRLWSTETYKTVSLLEPHMMSKRATNEGKQAPKMIKLKQPQGCGKRNSCVRFGAKGCTHLECDYLLSYSITNHTFLELEISGKTEGWVALGLSSDNKMGGDGAIVCKAKSALNVELEALTMSMAVPYSRPTPRQPKDISLVDQRVQNGHIYCKITKDLTKDDVQSSNTGLDLTNNWFQFYGKGRTDRHGGMLKHSKVPPTSLETVSMLRPYHVESGQYQQLSDSAPSRNLPALHKLTYCVLLPAICVSVVRSLSMYSFDFSI